MTTETEKEMLATLKSIANSLDILVRHARLVPANLGWTAAVEPEQPAPRAQPIGVPPTGKLQGQ